MKRRRLFRFIAYALLGVLTLLLLVLYSLYLSAQRMPAFYRDALALSPELQEVRNRELLQKVRLLNNDVQKTDRPWQAEFPIDELNAYLAVEAVKPGANLLPKDLRAPRLTLSSRCIELAFQVENGAFSGILNISFTLSLPEPNRLVLRIKEVRLGSLPLSRNRAVQPLREALEKQGYSVVPGTEAGDPTLSVTLDLKYGKDKSIRLEQFDLVDKKIRLSGSTTAID